MKKDIIREGDKVRVKIPKFVSRVGYPKSVDDYLTVLWEKHGTDLDAIFKMVSGHTGRFKTYLDKPPELSKQRLRVERELAYLMGRREHFGGNERSIHWLDIPEYAEVRTEVLGVRSVYTGTAYPPCSSTSYGGEYDYEPGGLANMKCHRIAEVRLYHTTPNKPLQLRKLVHLEIPVYHLEKIK